MPTAFVFITTDPVSMPVVLKTVRAIEGVVEAEMVYGVFDIVAKVQTETMDQLKQIVAFKLRMLANVLKTETLLAVLPE
jgi:DNA-binding Lrp family transcriptional regulator